MIVPKACFLFHDYVGHQDNTSVSAPEQPRHGPAWMESANRERKRRGLNELIGMYFIDYSTCIHYCLQTESLRRLINYSWIYRRKRGLQRR